MSLTFVLMRQQLENASAGTWFCQRVLSKKRQDQQMMLKVLQLDFTAQECTVTIHSTSMHRIQLWQQFATGNNCSNNVAWCSGDKITVLAEDESDDEEDEGFEGLGTEEIILP